MCGIAGFAFAGGSGSPAPGPVVLKRMCDVLNHRGPDDEGYFHNRSVGLGMRRLSVIDVAGGHQPISNEDGTVITIFNGEIYNFRELRAELQAAGHHFRSQSDTEVIVHAYEQWGDEFVGRLNGMYAFAVYDARNARLLLARDHVGIKPLYYYLERDTLVWGSEIKAVLASGLVERRLDLDALGQFLAWEYCPGEMTLFGSIHKLAPGRLLALDLRSGHHEIHRYWRPPQPHETEMAHSDEEWLERVDQCLRAAVKRQMVSDVPVGAFLSGGVDSSLITAAMGDALTFSIGFDDPTYNELPHSSAVARHLGVQHVTEIIQPNVLDLFDRLMFFLDDPIGDSSIFPTYLVAQLARRHVTVALSGDGGDELFGGYETYLAGTIAGRYEAIPAVIRRGLLEPAMGLLRPTRAKKGIVNKLIRFHEGVREDPRLRHARWRLFLNEAMQHRLFTPAALECMPSAIGAHVEALFDEAGRQGELGASLYVDTFSYLPDNILTKVDRMAMAVSLESRVPFLDKEMVELAFQVPDRLKVHNGTSKWILKRIAERYLPRAAVYRPKEGFSVPLKHWIAGGYRNLMQELLSPARIRREGIFRFEEVERLKSEHLAGRRNHSHQLWGIMVFQAWQDRWLNAGIPQGGA